MEIKKRGPKPRQITPEEIARYKKQVIKNFGFLRKANEILFEGGHKSKAKVREIIPDIDELIEYGKKRQIRRIRLGLHLARGNKTRAAEMFGISTRTIRSLLNKYRLQKTGPTIDLHQANLNHQKIKKPRQKLMSSFNFYKENLTPEKKGKFLKSVVRNFGNLDKASKGFYYGYLSRDNLRYKIPELDEYVEKGKKLQERRIRLALHIAMGNVPIAAKILNMKINKLNSLIKKFGFVSFNSKLKSANVTELESMLRKLETRLEELKMGSDK